MIYPVDSTIQCLNNWGQKRYGIRHHFARKPVVESPKRSQLFSHANLDVNPHIRLESSKGSLSLGFGE